MVSTTEGETSGMTGTDPTATISVRKQKYRTKTEVLESRKKLMQPSNLDFAPCYASIVNKTFPTPEALKERVQQCINICCSSSCGTFSVTLNGTRPANTKRGPIKYIKCLCNGASRPVAKVNNVNKTRNRTLAVAKSNCQWSLATEHICIEDSDGKPTDELGWMIATPSTASLEFTKTYLLTDGKVADDVTTGVWGLRASHNHQLLVTESQKLADPNLRGIPEDLIPKTKTLYEAKTPISKIFAYLEGQCRKVNNEFPFTDKDLRHYLAKEFPDSKFLDMDELLKIL